MLGACSGYLEQHLALRQPGARFRAMLSSLPQAAWSSASRSAPDYCCSTRPLAQRALTKSPTLQQ